MVAAVLACGAAGADEAPALFDRPLEDLLAVEVTTLGRRVQATQEFPGALSVIAGSDLRRGGARTVLEVLAQLPGISVERYNGRLSAVAVRGDGSSRYARNVLVLLDGRSQYSPLFGGVQWELLDQPIELVERIEVLRGSGSAVWGGHAVDSVINIVSARSAGAAASLQADSRGRLTSAARWTAAADAQATWTPSLWAALGGQRGSQTLLGRDDWDNETSAVVGGAARRALDGGAELRVDLDHRRSSGGYDLADGGPPGTPAVRHERYRTTLTQGGLRWSQPDGAGGSFDVDAALLSSRSELTGRYDLQRNALEVQAQRRWRIDGHDLQLGGGADWAVQRDLAPFGRPQPQRRRHGLRAFVQDERTFDDGRSAWTAALQVEHLDGSGTTWSPALRLRHALSADLTAWGAIAWSANEPIETELSGGGGPRRPPPPGAPPAGGPPAPGDPGAPGGPGGAPSEPPARPGSRGVPSLDFGLRARPTPGWQWNAAVYWRRYHDAAAPPPPLPQARHVDVAGLELDTRWQPSQDWDLGLAWTHTRARPLGRPGEPSPSEALYLGTMPRQRLTAKAGVALGAQDRLEANFVARSALPAAGLSGMGRLDLSWRRRSGALEWGLALLQANRERLALYGPSEAGVLRFDSRRSARALLSWETR